MAETTDTKALYEVMKIVGHHVNRKDLFCVYLGNKELASLAAVHSEDSRHSRLSFTTGGALSYYVDSFSSKARRKLHAEAARHGIDALQMTVAATQLPLSLEAISVLAEKGSLRDAEVLLRGELPGGKKASPTDLLRVDPGAPDQLNLIIGHLVRAGRPAAAERLVELSRQGGLVMRLWHGSLILAAGTSGCPVTAARFGKELPPQRNDRLLLLGLLASDMELEDIQALMHGGGDGGEPGPNQGNQGILAQMMTQDYAAAAAQSMRRAWQQGVEFAEQQDDCRARSDSRAVPYSACRPDAETCVPWLLERGYPLDQWKAMGLVRLAALGRAQAVSLVIRRAGQQLEPESIEEACVAAAKAGCMEVLELLIRELGDRVRWTYLLRAVHAAAGEGMRAVVTWLLEKLEVSRNLSQQQEVQQDVLEQAVRSCSPRLVKELLERYPSVRGVPALQERLTEAAAVAGCPAILYLLQHYKMLAWPPVSSCWESVFAGSDLLMAKTLRQLGCPLPGSELRRLVAMAADKSAMIPAVAWALGSDGVDVPVEERTRLLQSLTVGSPHAAGTSGVWQQACRQCVCDLLHNSLPPSACTRSHKRKKM